jgi:hypothetical protein
MKTKRAILACIITLSLIKPVKTLAWGAQGHRLVVDMALSLISPQAKQNVLAAIGNSYSPDLAAVWMDSVRINRVPEYSYMDNWHFLNMEANQTYSQVASQSDVVYNLQRVIDFFNAGTTVSPDSLRRNVLILFHLMGDITQPLHDGYGSDRGANDDLVTTPVYNGTDNNLHHVWDDIIIQVGHVNLQSLLTYYHNLSPATVSTITQGNTIDWAMQARSYLPQVYSCNPSPHSTTALSMQYLKSNVPIVQQQLVFAAVRLAGVLQKTFGS